MLALSALLVILPSCTWFENEQFTVTGGWDVYVNIRARDSRTMVHSVFEGACVWNIYCTRELLQNNVIFGPADYEISWIDATDSTANMYSYFIQYGRNGAICMNMGFYYWQNFDSWGTMGIGNGCKL